MRIVASNPDTLGDLILRQPMYQALTDAGHELLLVVRPLVAPLARHIAPRAKVVELPYETYAHDLPEQWDRFTSLFDAAREFKPDALLIAPYRWTLFDERLARELPGVKRFGLSGHLYRGDPYRGNAPASGLQFDVVVEVCEDALEVEKNAALASGMLGGPPKRLPDPRLNVPQAATDGATQTLSELGLKPGQYWIGCVAGTTNVPLKAWRAENWASVLSRWVANHDRRFLFVGLASEEPDTRAVREAMGDAGRTHTRLWMPDEGKIDELLALTALSSGYVGHDTGPMHAAAAFGKPVLAVFGGGARLRFAPAVEPSVVVTVGVSCRGCQWVCSFAESHCVKAVPVDEVVRAAEDLESGRVTGREARVLEPSPALQAQMIREVSAVAQDRLRSASELSRELQVVQTSRQRDVAELQSQADARARETARTLETVTAEHQKAVDHAHAELGSQLREKESMIRQQDGQLREKEAALHEQHLLMQKQNETLHRSAAEAEQLRGHALAASQRSDLLGTELEARAAELSRLQAEFDGKTREAAELAVLSALQRREIDRLGAAVQDIEQIHNAGAEAARKHAEEFGKLREQLQRLEERVRVIEPQMRPRRTFKQVLVDFIIGPQHFYPLPPASLPGITVVTVTHNSASSIRRTIESVLGQTHAHVQHVVVDCGSTDDTHKILDEYEGRIDKVVTEGVGDAPFDAMSQGYGRATYDVIGRLDPGELYEPGALTLVAEHFRDHPADKAAVFDEVVADAGWRFPAPPRTTPDVYSLLADEGESAAGVFVTTNAYKALGGINRERGHAGDWDFLVRLSRRYGINVGRGHVRTVQRGTELARDGEASSSRRGDLQQARELFASSFGWPGKIRCGLIHLGNRIDDAARRLLPGRLSFPLCREAKPLPSGKPPPYVPGQPVSPLSGRLPDHLLFSTRDTAGGDDAVSYVYYDTAGDTALVYPAIDLDKLRAIYQHDRGVARPIVQPDAAKTSPYAGYRARGAVARLLSRVRSPYWWFHTPDFGDPSVRELLDTLDGPIPRRGMDVRFLNIGCFEGGVLDALKDQTDWRLFGTETNGHAAEVARSNGHTVWETSAEDAALTIPIGEVFDVIYLGGTLEHLADPLLVIRRLRQILSPGGRIVIDTPNLDSKLLDAFGPTWSLWQAPYHRTLLGRRGLRALAQLAAFRVERLRTRTHPLAAVRSVQLNDLGLGAVVPDTAEFPPEVASRGVLLAGWARLLWDWRGRGDYLYAVLRAE